MVLGFYEEGGIRSTVNQKEILIIRYSFRYSKVKQFPPLHCKKFARTMAQFS